MVFGDGDGDFEVVADSDCDEEGADEEVVSEGGSRQTAMATILKRDHKRLKHWGKKNKKLRDKNPYGDESGVVSYAAYSTNRSGIFSGIDATQREKVKRQDPRQPYGNSFVRAALPHHQLHGKPQKD
jgi:hypothetical protein